MIEVDQSPELDRAIDYQNWRMISMCERLARMRVDQDPPALAYKGIYKVTGPVLSPTLILFTRSAPFNPQTKERSGFTYSIQFYPEVPGIRSGEPDRSIDTGSEGFLVFDRDKTPLGVCPVASQVELDIVTHTLDELQFYVDQQRLEANHLP